MHNGSGGALKPRTVQQEGRGAWTANFHRLPAKLGKQLGQVVQTNEGPFASISPILSEITVYDITFYHHMICSGAQTVFIIASPEINGRLTSHLSHPRALLEMQLA